MGSPALVRLDLTLDEDLEPHGRAPAHTLERAFSRTREDDATARDPRAGLRARDGKRGERTRANALRR
jgi:hypothetical protein